VFLFFAIINDGFHDPVHFLSGVTGFLAEHPCGENSLKILMHGVISSVINFIEYLLDN
jgi:hypothetical protein